MDLGYLELLLENLPDNIPTGETFYNFRGWAPDPDIVARYEFEDVDALNRDLEIAFIHDPSKGKPAHGLDPFKEQGRGLVAVVGTLKKYFPESDARRTHWIERLTVAAEDAYKASGKPLPSTNTQDTRIPIPTVPEITPPIEHPDSQRKPKKRARNKEREKIIPWYDFVSSEEDEPRGKGGAKPDFRVRKVSVPCRPHNDPTIKKIRCIGMKPQPGKDPEDVCQTTWSWPRNKQRILSHAAECAYIPAAIKDEIQGELASKSLTSKLDKMFDKKDGVPPKTRGELKSSTPASRQLGNNFPSGAQDDASISAKQPSVLPFSRQAAKKHLQASLDLAILKWMVVAGIPPNAFDYPQWKDIWKIAAADYEPPSSNTVSKVHIVNEAARVRKKQLDALKTSENLSITFDGGTTEGKESIYSIHIITPERRVYIFDGHEASGISHTGEHLYQVLKKIIEEVGPMRFGHINSDDTGNTCFCRKKVQQAYPWILNTPDPCHRLNNLLKDISTIPHFQPVIKSTRRVVKFFHKSTFAGARLKAERRRQNLGRGLQAFGKTRFGTLYHSGSSVQRNLPAIRHLVGQEVVRIPEVNDEFSPGHFKSLQYAHSLHQLINVMQAPARSITCLESSHATFSDVFLHWLAVQSSMKDALESPALGLPIQVSESIRQFCNYRFKQTIEDAPSDVFLAAFYLDPRYRGQNILKDVGLVNPLQLPKLHLVDGQASVQRPEKFTRIGNFLSNMLREEYMSKKIKIGGMTGFAAMNQLKEGLDLWAEGTYPFHEPLGPETSPYLWWAARSKNPGAVVLSTLAMKLFAATPNSMADERFASVVNWINTKRRNRQKAATLVRLVMLRSEYRWEAKMDNLRNIPTVKYRDLHSLIDRPARLELGKRKRGDDDESEDITSGSEDDEEAYNEESDDENVSNEEDDVARQEDSANFEVAKDVFLDDLFLKDIHQDFPIASLPKRNQPSPQAHVTLDDEGEVEWHF